MLCCAAYIQSHSNRNLSITNNSGTTSLIKARTKSDLLNIVYNTRISWETHFREVDETGVDETGVDETGINHSVSCPTGGLGYVDSHVSHLISGLGLGKDVEYS